MIDINKVKTYSMRKRHSKVGAKDFARAPLRKRSFLSFYNCLPNLLKAKELEAIVEAVVRAHKRKKPVIFMLGAHVIKSGLNPVLI